MRGQVYTTTSVCPIMSVCNYILYTVRKCQLKGRQLMKQFIQQDNRCVFTVHVNKKKNFQCPRCKKNSLTIPLRPPSLSTTLEAHPKYVIFCSSPRPTYQYRTDWLLDFLTQQSHISCYQQRTQKPFFPSNNCTFLTHLADTRRSLKIYFSMLAPFTTGALWSFLRRKLFFLINFI